jgi:hypothetical protein
VVDGVPASRIAVAGHSKGGMIALRAAALLEDPRFSEIRWVLLAGCFPDRERDLRLPERSLSLFDVSDRLAVSCQPWMRPSSTERQFDTGLGHGLFYRPDTAWLTALTDWLLDGRGN